MRQMHSGIWRSLTRSRRLIPGGLGARHPHASALTGRTELSFETRRLEWLTLYEAARVLRSDYSAVLLAPRSNDPASFRFDATASSAKEKCIAMTSSEQTVRVAWVILRRCLVFGFVRGVRAMIDENEVKQVQEPPQVQQQEQSTEQNVTDPTPLEQPVAEPQAAEVTEAPSENPPPQVAEAPSEDPTPAVAEAPSDNPNP